MLAQNVIFRNGDSHAIYDAVTNNRINNAEDVIIRDKIWFDYNTTILKGVQTHSCLVIGTGAIVTKSPGKPSCILAGVPARIVKEGVY